MEAVKHEFRFTVLKVYECRIIKYRIRDLPNIAGKHIQDPNYPLMSTRVPRFVGAKSSLRVLHSPPPFYTIRQLQTQHS